MRGNKSPAPPVTAASCGVLNQRLRNKTTVLGLVAILAVFSACATQQQVTPEKNFSIRLIENGTAVEITGFRKHSVSDLIIPSSIQGLPVVSIGDTAFFNKQIATVFIPPTVRRIGNGAFGDNNIR
ncbi:MAG: leucine-rich repeat domain-containing protein, partial [Treponema sp.]|nr:leucine-rich repeat domain-containing protein [Treponema sp.]